MFDGGPALDKAAMCLSSHLERKDSDLELSLSHCQERSEHV